MTTTFAKTFASQITKTAKERGHFPAVVRVDLGAAEAVYMRQGDGYVAVPTRKPGYQSKFAHYVNLGSNPGSVVPPMTTNWVTGLKEVPHKKYKEVISTILSTILGAVMHGVKTDLSGIVEILGTEWLTLEEGDVSDADELLMQRLGIEYHYLEFFRAIGARPIIDVAKFVETKISPKHIEVGKGVWNEDTSILVRTGRFSTGLVWAMKDQGVTLRRRPKEKNLEAPTQAVAG